jgi:MEDS: MEthanogen/methylotroph, DcmR Sensory domain
MVYDGPAGRHLRPISRTVRDKLIDHYRCIYLNSEPMIAEFRTYLAAAGVDVELELRQSNLILSSERPHLVRGRFEIRVMLETLQTALDRALSDGYIGLWATGDMTWEMGRDHDVMKLLQYEWRLERFIQSHPQFGGVCQYHVNSFPMGLLDQAVALHPEIYVNETLSILNAKYTPLGTNLDPCIEPP